MDGRVQRAVFDYVAQRFDADHVDMITEAGPVKILAERTDERCVAATLYSIGVSIEKHQTKGLAVAGHEDCGGNPSPRDVQAEQTRETVRFLKDEFPELKIIGLWVELSGKIEEIC